MKKISFLASALMALPIFSVLISRRNKRGILSFFLIFKNSQIKIKGRE
ncbi:MAG: hypothetical protein NTV63_04120 [Candidatus Woesearchaeota archaeon]|nr:hypothetical protein [Candidatus Woesearchaeota archaeon]